MTIPKEIKNKRDLILNDWFSCIVSSYSIEISEFIKNQSDFFNNPVGRTIFSSLSTLLNGIIYKGKISLLRPTIDSIVRIRAVQGFKGSDAIGFFFSLKKIFRKYLSNKNNSWIIECEIFIDKLAISAFDVFMICKEQLYRLKANEARNHFFNSLHKAGLISSI